MVYTDRGTGARLGVTVYGPALSAIPNGYYMVGMSAVPATSAAGNRQMLYLVNPERDCNAIAAPLGFSLIWKDKGSGGDMDGSFWRVNCPRTYVHDKYVTKAKLGNLIWNDRKSGADTDISLWEIENIRDSPNQELVGCFKATNRYSRPNTQVFGLPVVVP